MGSLDKSSKDDESDDGSLSMNAFDDIWDRSQIHPEISVIDDILKLHDHIKQTQNEWKGAELSVKSISKVSHRLFFRSHGIISRFQNCLVESSF